MSYGIEQNSNLISIRIESATKKIIQGVDVAANSFLNRVVRDAKINAPEAETVLKNSIKVKRFGAIDYEAGPEVGYGGHVESGTGKGGVPTLQSMLDWIRVRRIFPRNEKFDEVDLAFAIQQSIKKKGTPQQPYMEPALQKNLPLLDRLISRELERE